MVRFPTSVSPPGVVSGVAALLLSVFGGFPDFDGGRVDVSSLANGAALAGTLVHGNSVGSNAPAGRYSHSRIGDTLLVESGSFFAKKSLMRYLVFVPREVLLPLGQPEGLVVSPSGTFSGGPNSAASSVPRAGTDGSLYRHSPPATRPHLADFPAVCTNPQERLFSANKSVFTRTKRKTRGK